MSDSTRSRWHSLRETISLLSSVYSVILLIGLLASIVIQIQPLFVFPIGVEVAKYSMVFFASVLISYITFKRVTRKENSELRRFLSSLNRIMIFDLRISHYLMSRLRDVYLGRREGELESFDFVIEEIKNKEEAIQQISSAKKKYPKLLTLPTEGSIGTIIEISSIWKIPFEELAYYLCQKLGKENAKRLVKIEKILKCYGKEEVSMWKSITEST